MNSPNQTQPFKLTSPILTNSSDLGLSGRIRLVLKPKIDQFPFFGGLQFCFLDVPEISFELDGIADIIDWPPIKRLVRVLI